jgi:hypothetical protein
MRRSWKWMGITAVLAACGGKAVVDGKKGAGGAGGGATNGTTNATTGTVAPVTTTPVNCADIANQYRAAVKNALGCNPALSVEQCTKRVAADIEACCSQDAWVNGTDMQKVATIDQLAQAYKGAGCDAKCQAVDCAPQPPTVGSCQGDGQCHTIVLMPPGG